MRKRMEINAEIEKGLKLLGRDLAVSNQEVLRRALNLYGMLAQNIMPGSEVTAMIRGNGKVSFSAEEILDTEYFDTIEIN